MLPELLTSAHTTNSRGGFSNRGSFLAGCAMPFDVEPEVLLGVDNKKNGGKWLNIQKQVIDALEEEDFSDFF